MNLLEGSSCSSCITESKMYCTPADWILFLSAMAENFYISKLIQCIIYIITYNYFSKVLTPRYCWHTLMFALNTNQSIKSFVVFLFTSSVYSVIWPRICSTGRKHIQVLSSFTTYHRVCNWSNMTGATSGAGTAYPSGAPEFTLGFLLGFVLLDL
jgi:hypothetical protein